MAINWEKLVEIARGDTGQSAQPAANAQPTASVKPVAAPVVGDSDVGSAAGKPNAAMQPMQPVKAVNPGAITQSFYTTPTNSGNYEQGRPVYVQSQAVRDAGDALSAHQANKPGEYVSQYNEQIQSLISQALNRPKFHYDYSEDPMYRMYADKYQLHGQMAMKGAQGESAALSGGYGNSYAQQVGQQTYQTYLQSLNDIIPTLRNQAYQQYQDEGDTMRANLGMLQTEEGRQYGLYRDKVDDWRSDLNYLYTQFSDMSQREYERYANDQQAWERDRAYWYQKAYDEQQQRNWEREFEAKYGSGGGGGGGGGKPKPKSEPVYVPDHGVKSSNTITDVLDEYQRKNKMGKYSNT